MPGETVEVPVAVSPRQWRHWDVEEHGWALEPGEFELSSGPHVGDLRVHCTVQIEASEMVAS